MPGLELIAEQSISLDKRTMMTTINFKNSADYADLTTVSRDLIKFAADASTKPAVYSTGMPVLNQQMSDATTKNFELIDETVLPLSLIVLATCHMELE